MISSIPVNCNPNNIPSSFINDEPKRIVDINNTKDSYCWNCHQQVVNLSCKLCLRSFHKKCLYLYDKEPNKWICPECDITTKSECIETRNIRFGNMSIKKLGKLLKIALENAFLHIKSIDLKEFLKPVDKNIVHDYENYVIQPTDFSLIRRRIDYYHYTSTYALLADVKWIVHNSCIYNGTKHHLTLVAKQVIKHLTREIKEIEICYECYEASNQKTSSFWFCNPCSQLHTIVSAKLKGYPMWPAKVLQIEKGQADVRFFGEHDRAWVPLNSVFLLSKQHVILTHNEKKLSFVDSLSNALEELKEHIRLIEDLIGSFLYSEPKTLLSEDYNFVQIEKNCHIIRNNDNDQKLSENVINCNEPVIKKKKISVTTCNGPQAADKQIIDAKNVSNIQYLHSDLLLDNNEVNLVDSLLKRVSSVDDAIISNSEVGKNSISSNKEKEFCEKINKLFKELDSEDLITFEIFQKYTNLIDNKMMTTFKSFYDEIITIYKNREIDLKQKFKSILKDMKTE